MAIKNRLSSLKSQTGAALLTFVLIIIIGASYMLVTKLNTNLALTQQSKETGIALSAAKNALIGYAVSYPDKVNAASGPGYLPCPDKDNDGDAEGSCVLGGTNNTVGRFPFERLEMAELRDGSGQRLWYAISDNFKNNPKTTPLNSDSTGALFINGTSDIVAVIIAPGAPVDGQTRDITEIVIANEIVNYLEGDNNNLDTSYITTLGDSNRKDGEYDANDNYTFNDRVVFITRQELMQAVEKRVLGEVKQALLNYQTSYGAFPWLSPFSDPSASAFRGATATVQGHIPFHWSNDPDSIDQGGSLVERNPFLTNIGVRWDNISSANIGTITDVTEFSTVSSACLNDIESCDEGGVFPVISQLNSSSAVDCTWTTKNTADCDSFTVSTAPVAYVQDAVNCPLGGTLTRTYTITFPVITSVATIDDPTATSTRLRDVSLTATNPTFLPAQVNAIKISDKYTGDYFTAGACTTEIDLDVSTRTSTFDADTEGTIAINDIQYDLDIDDNELPSWFYANDWHHHLYIAYPATTAEALPGAATLCTVDADCIELVDSGEPNWNKRAIAIIAGSELDNITCEISGTVSTPDGSGVTLIDDGARFQADYIEINDTILNNTDSSSGQVVSVNSNTEITLDGLSGGTDNGWELGDIYEVTKTFDQDRTRGNISEYYEIENCNQNQADVMYQAGEVIDTFNDQVKVISTSP
ncbi:MAG: type II secretory pathway pseudopilin PulG [Gammaproteobacteria bacterium]|jgi:type II secretory pathway pseudopilin PulG